MGLPLLPVGETPNLDTQETIEHLAAQVTRWRQEVDVALATRHTYERAIRLFLDWLKRSDLPPTPQTIGDWREELTDAGHKPASINVWLSGVRNFFNWALKTGLVLYNPVAGVRGATRQGIGSTFRRDELTATEVLNVLATCDESLLGRRDRAIICLMAYCALRQVEICRANLQDLKIKDDRLVLWVQGKGRAEKTEFVVLPAPAEEAVGQWLVVRPKGGTALFVGVGNRSRGRLHARTIRRMVKQRFTEASVVGKGKTTYSLRHGAINTAMRNGAQLQQVRAMARYTNITTIMTYTHKVDRMLDPAEDYVRYSV